MQCNNEDNNNDDDRNDKRWVEGGAGRYTEYGVVGAEQADESHFDNRIDDEESSEGERGRIQFPQKTLYGREKELQFCHELYESMMQGHQEQKSSSATAAAVFLSGYSGCGKSALVQEFVKQISSSNETPAPLFLSAKYEAMKTLTPFGAFGSLFDHIDNVQTWKDLHHVQTHLQELLGDDIRILGKIFPRLPALLVGMGEGKPFNNDFLGSSSRQSTNNSEEFSVCSQRSSLSRSGRSALTAQFGTTRKIPRERMNFAIQALFRSMCSVLNRPLILFMDDLQWADEHSLDLISILLKDTSLGRLFFFGSYRSNEVDENHPFHMKVLQGIVHNNQNNDNAKILELSELGREDVAKFIADTLQLEVDEVQTLTDAVFPKTLGNIFYTKQALEQLARENVLYYDTIMFSWTWNLKDDFQRFLSVDLVEMIRSKVWHLSPELQTMLLVASYTRSTFDVDTLFYLLQNPQQQAVMTEDEEKQEMPVTDKANNEHRVSCLESFTMVVKTKEELIKLLEQAILEGLVQHTGNTNEYAFAHDKFQEAVQALLPSNDHNSNQATATSSRKRYTMAILERDGFFVEIGTNLAVRAESEQGEDWMYFAAAEHLNSVNDSFKQRRTIDELIELATLNSKTAELSIELFAFANANEFVRHGMENLKSAIAASLPDDDDTNTDTNNTAQITTLMWSTQPELALKLHSIGAEGHHGIGNSEESERYCNEVTEQSIFSLYDKIPVYKIYVDVLAGRAEKSEKSKAYALTLDILEQLGLSLPKSPRMQRLKAWVILQEIKAFYIPSEKSINDMPNIPDSAVKEMFTMDMISKASSFAMAEDGGINMYVLLCCEAMRGISKYGLHDGSGSAVASFANVLTHNYGDFQTGKRLAELAILIQDRMKNKYFETRPLNTANIMVLGWMKPIRTCLPYHVRAFESGMVSGNLEGACVGKWQSCWPMLFAALPLRALEEDLKASVPKMRSIGYPFFANLACIPWQISMNMMGMSENTVLLIGEAMNESTDMIYSAVKIVEQVLSVFKSFVYMIFGDFESGAELALERGDIYPELMGHLAYGLEPFFRAMSLYAMARRSHRSSTRKSLSSSPYKKPAAKALKKTQKWVNKGCINLVGPLQLLKAECAALAGKKKRAVKLYEGAVSILNKDGFHHFAGLANERLADYFLHECGDLEGANVRITYAINCYNRWGAKKKVKLLRGVLQKISSKNHTQKSLDSSDAS